MSIEGQGHFITIYFAGFECFVLYEAEISGERLQDHWSSSFKGCSSSVGTQRYTRNIIYHECEIGINKFVPWFTF